MTPADAPLLMVVDGNGLLHRAHHGWAAEASRDAEGRPIWGLRGLVISIAAAAARLRPDAVLVGFDCTEHSVRRVEFEDYKAQRPAKPADLIDQLTTAPQLLQAAGFAVHSEFGCEADDVLATAAARAVEQGWRTVLVTSDRDAFALINGSVSVLRVVKGGVDESPLMGPDDVFAEYGVTPGQYHDFAALRGDPSDNLRGVFGIGEKTAAKLLGAFGTLDDALAAVDARPAEVAGVVGAAVVDQLSDADQRATLSRTRALMAPRMELAVPEPDSVRLPFDAHRMRTALSARKIFLGPSLWALTGGQPPAWTPPGFDRAPSYLPRVEPPPWALNEWREARERLLAAREAAAGLSGIADGRSDGAGIGREEAQRVLLGAAAEGFAPAGVGSRSDVASKGGPTSGRGADSPVGAGSGSGTNAPVTRPTTAGRGVRARKPEVVLPGQLTLF